MRHDQYLKQYDALSAEVPLSQIPLRKEYILREIGRGKRVLDLGCLGGQISKLIKDQNNEVFGIEVNPRAAHEAESKGIRVKLFDLNDGIPFEDGLFDVVHAGEIVESIYDTKALFEECNRVLKANGFFIFTTPNLNSLANRLRVLSGGYLSSVGAFPEDHGGRRIRIFNVPKLREICAHTGFRVERVYGIPALSRQSVQYRLLRPMAHVVPQWCEMIVVKARRIDL